MASQNLFYSSLKNNLFCPELFVVSFSTSKWELWDIVLLDLWLLKFLGDVSSLFPILFTVILLLFEKVRIHLILLHQFYLHLKNAEASSLINF